MQSRGARKKMGGVCAPSLKGGVGRWVCGVEESEGGPRAPSGEETASRKPGPSPLRAGIPARAT